MKFPLLIGLSVITLGILVFAALIGIAWWQRDWGSVSFGIIVFLGFLLVIKVRLDEDLKDDPPKPRTVNHE